MFSSGFRIGSAFSTSCTMRTLPKRSALSSWRMKFLSRKEVFTTRLLLNRFIRNVTPCSLGSTSSG